MKNWIIREVESGIEVATFEGDAGDAMQATEAMAQTFGLQLSLCSADTPLILGGVSVRPGPQVH
jgi:hypothetical protein